jgi:hypothetical protein
MSKITRRSLLIVALTARGYVHDGRNLVMRCAVYRATDGSKALIKTASYHTEGIILNHEYHRIYIGHSGTLRYSHRGVVTESVPFGETTIELLVAEGEAVIG